MKGERLVELINLEIDGEISSEEEIELRTEIASDEDASKLRDQLYEVSREIEGLSWVDPPVQFKKTVLDRIRAESPPKDRESLVRFSTGERRRLLFRYAWALAAGLVIGLLLAPRLLDQRSPDVRPDDATGAMRQQLAVSGWDAFDEQTIDNAAFAGVINAQRSNGTVAIEFHLQLQNSPAIELRYDAEQFGLAGVSRVGSIVEPLFLEPGVVRIGADRFLEATIFLADLRPEAADIELELISFGEGSIAETIRLEDSADHGESNQLFEK